MLRDLKSGLALLILLVVASAGQAQSVIYSETFDAPLPAGWSVDGPVGTPGVQWAADATPATTSGMYGCGLADVALVGTVFAGAGCLNWNDGVAIAYGAATGTPFESSVTSPVISLTTLTGVTLSFTEMYEMDSCNDETAFHNRFVDFIDASTGSVVMTRQFANVDTAPASADTIAEGAGMHDHYIITFFLDLLPEFAAITAIDLQVRFRVQITGYLGDVGGLGIDAEEELTGWFIDNLTVTCPAADLAAPTVPTQLAPVGGPTVVSPVAFDWTDATDTGPCGPAAVTYVVEIDNLGTIPSPDLTLTPTPSSVTQALVPGAYSWRVRARDSAGNLSAFTAAELFTVEANLAPLAPDTLFVNTQNNGAQNGDGGFVSPVIDEQPVFSAIFRDANVAPDFAGQVRFQVSEDPTFTLIDYDSGTILLGAPLPDDARCPDLQILISLQRDTVYYWRCQFIDVGGLTGPFSGAQSFRIGDDFEFGVRRGSSHRS
ncbi:MAG: hypothetical protein HUU15_00495, partial [Candidatus Brocadiae bacterium]|nr:hypothetical protein [Candidatus Brocadiia bacterium]